MVIKAEEYEYVVGDNIDDEHPHGDMDRIIIDGEVMPLREGVSATTGVERKRILRGEDICFLLEWLLQRKNRMYRCQRGENWSTSTDESVVTFSRQIQRIANANAKKNKVWGTIGWMGWLWGSGTLYDGWPHLCFFKEEDIQNKVGDGHLKEGARADAEYFAKENLTHVDLWAKDFNPYQGGVGKVTTNGIVLTLEEVENYFTRFQEADRLGYGCPSYYASPAATVRQLYPDILSPSLSTIGAIRECYRSKTAEKYGQAIGYATPGYTLFEITQKHAVNVILYIAFIVDVQEKQVGASTISSRKIVGRKVQMTKKGDGVFSCATDIISEAFVSQIISAAGIDIDGWTSTGSATGYSWLQALITPVYMPIVWYDDHTCIT